MLLFTLALYKPNSAQLYDKSIQVRVGYVTQKAAPLQFENVVQKILKELVEALNVSSIVDKAQQLETRVLKSVRHRTDRSKG